MVRRLFCRLNNHLCMVSFLDFYFDNFSYTITCMFLSHSSHEGVIEMGGSHMGFFGMDNVKRIRCDLLSYFVMRMPLIGYFVLCSFLWLWAIRIMHSFYLCITFDCLITVARWSLRRFWLFGLLWVVNFSFLCVGGSSSHWR